MRPQPAHSREVVLQLRQLDLKLAVGGVRVAGEDVENYGRPIDDRDLQLSLQVAFLARSKFVIADDHVGVRGLRQQCDLLELAGTEISIGMDRLAPLRDLADNGHACGLKQLIQLLEIGLLGRRCDAESALFRTPFSFASGGAWGRATAMAVALLHEPRSVERAAGSWRFGEDGAGGPTFACSAR